MKTRTKTLIVLSVVVLLLALFSIKFYTIPQKNESQKDTEVSADTLFAGSSESESNLNKVTSLQPHSNSGGQGDLYRSFDGQFYTTVLNAKLPSLDKNKYYEAWLVKDNPSKDYYPLGRMYQRGDNYTTTNISELSRPDYHSVLITEEVDSGVQSSNPGKVVLSGTF